MRLEWSALALEDREGVFDFIEALNPLAAIDMDERIAARIDHLRQFPQSGRSGRVEGTFELVVPRTPYIVAYRMELDVIIVLRVLHGAQLWPDSIDGMPHS
ncbi:MAG: type II toxin-antitoxin system RelE/ParE family toxin [Pseudomonadota bacterium]